MFSDLEILEIHQQIYRQTHQQTPATVTKTLNIGKPQAPNQTLHDNDSYTANAQTKKLTQEKKIMKMSWKENYIALSQEPWLEDSQVRKRESKRLIDKYPD